MFWGLSQIKRPPIQSYESKIFWFWTKQETISSLAWSQFWSERQKTCKTKIKKIKKWKDYENVTKIRKTAFIDRKSNAKSLIASIKCLKTTLIDR